MLFDRSLNLDEEHEIGNRTMRKLTNTEQYSKERCFGEHNEDGQILTAQPVSSSYTVSCITNGDDGYYRHAVVTPPRLSEAAGEVQGRRSRVNQQNGISNKSAEKINGFVPSNRKAPPQPEAQNVYEGQTGQFVSKHNRNFNVSKVRFEESWEDSPGRKPDYKVREATGMTIPIRDETAGYKTPREIPQTNGNGDVDNFESKGNANTNLDTSTKSTIKSVQGKISLNTSGQDKPASAQVKDHKRDVPSRHDGGNRLDCGSLQGRSEVGRIDESKPLGLRQLIKIHEIQIAEVAKSAASMKKPTSAGKVHEGRLVKVKIVPEIETKQSHAKQNAARVTFAGNKSSSDSPSPRKIQSGEVRSNVLKPANEREVLNVKNEASLFTTRAAVKPKRHTVELRTKPPIQENQKWKRHTAIGLVGFDHQENEVPHGELDELSPKGNSEKKMFTSDSDAEVEYLRKQPVEPEEQFVDEWVKKSNVMELKTSAVHKEINELQKEADERKVVLDNESEVPPERPPLPKNFYSSAEQIIARPPPPVYKKDIENISTLDFKQLKTDYGPRMDFKPNIEHALAADIKPTYGTTADVKPTYGTTTDIKPTYGAATDIKPTYGATADIKPTYGTTADIKPTYGTTADIKPTYGPTADIKPTYGATADIKPTYGATADIKPTYGPTADIKPTYGTTADIKPTYGTTADIKPTYGATADIKPTYGPTADIKPTYGTTADIKPTYGTTADIKPTYGPTADIKPTYDATSGIKPTYGATADIKPAYSATADIKPTYGPTADIKPKTGYSPMEIFTPSTEFVPKVDFEPNVEYIKASPLSERTRPRPITLSSSLPALHVSTAIVQSNGEDILEQEHIQEKDHVLGKTRTTREMYEERLARINLVPLVVSDRHQEMVSSLCSSLESFAWDNSCNFHNLNKSEYLDKLKTYMKQMKVLTKQKEELEKNFERERRDWKRKYEEQQKVANAYQKLEDRYRRQVQELQEALKLCRCTDTETRKALFLGQSG